MKLSDLPPHMQPLLDRFLREGRAVWLMGSRANPTNKEPNDWDILVFGDEALLKELRTFQAIDDLDLFVVLNDGHFESPWPSPLDGVIKKGSFQSWEWTQSDANTATYEGTKWPDDWGSPKRAIRILP